MVKTFSLTIIFAGPNAIQSLIILSNSFRNGAMKVEIDWINKNFTAFLVTFGTYSKLIKSIRILFCYICLEINVKITCFILKLN
jgi:hypothetical protein